MPTLHVELFAGRTVEQKRALAAALTEACVKTLGGSPEAVDILFRDVERHAVRRPPAEDRRTGRRVPIRDAPGLCLGSAYERHAAFSASESTSRQSTQRPGRTLHARPFTTPQRGQMIIRGISRTPAEGSAFAHRH